MEEKFLRGNMFESAVDTIVIFLLELVFRLVRDLSSRSFRNFLLFIHIPILIYLIICDEIDHTKSFLILDPLSSFYEHLLVIFFLRLSNPVYYNIQSSDVLQGFKFIRVVVILGLLCCKSDNIKLQFA